MNDKSIGDAEAITGNIEDVKYNIFCLKGSNYTMKLMSTYGVLAPPLNQDDTF